MYRYVAPKDGTLKLHLAETNANFAVYLIDGCEAATEAKTLSCSNMGWPPGSEENLAVPLVAGKEVTVVVDTVNPSTGGAFSLEAKFE